MAEFRFGKAFTLNYFYNASFAPSADNPVIYIFRDKPDRSSAIAGTGAIQTISSWSAGSIADSKAISVSAITDPHISDVQTDKVYYAAVKYTLVASGQVQTDIIPFTIGRASGTPDNFNISVTLIKEIYPAISNYLTDSQIDDKLDQTIDEVRLELEAKGHKWDKILRKDLLYLPIAYRTIANCSLSQIVEQDDKFDYRYNLFMKLYLEYLQNLTLAEDNNNDGEADKNISLETDFSIVKH